MKHALKVLRTIVSALGWLLLGVLLRQLEIGPWWVNWLCITIPTCVIAVVIDGAMEPKGRWRI